MVSRHLNGFNLVGALAVALNQKVSNTDHHNEEHKHLHKECRHDTLLLCASIVVKPTQHRPLQRGTHKHLHRENEPVLKMNCAIIKELRGHIPQESVGMRRRSPVVVVLCLVRYTEQCTVIQQYSCTE